MGARRNCRDARFVRPLKAICKRISYIFWNGRTSRASLHAFKRFATSGILYGSTDCIMQEREQEETVGTRGSCVHSRHFTQNTPLSNCQSCPNVSFIQGKCVSLHVEMPTHNRGKSAQNLQSRPASAINRREKSYINTTSYERL